MQTTKTSQMETIREKVKTGPHSYEMTYIIKFNDQLGTPDACVAIDVNDNMANVWAEFDGQSTTLKHFEGNVSDAKKFAYFEYQRIVKEYKKKVVQ